MVLCVSLGLKTNLPRMLSGSMWFFFPRTIVNPTYKTYSDKPEASKGFLVMVWTPYVSGDGSAGLESDVGGGVMNSPAERDGVTGGRVSSRTLMWELRAHILGRALCRQETTVGPLTYLKNTSNAWPWISRGVNIAFPESLSLDSNLPNCISNVKQTSFHTCGWL